MPEVRQALKEAKSYAELAEQLTESKLHASLETAQVIYSITSALWRACAKRIDIRGLWKMDLQPSLSRWVQWIRQQQTNGAATESEFSRFITGEISPVDNAVIAAECGILTRSFDNFCWAVCDGHSHRPGIELVRAPHPQSGQEFATLLVNCGKFHGKNMTVAIFRFPEAAILEWDDREQSYYVWQHERLSLEEQQHALTPQGPAAVARAALDQPNKSSSPATESPHKPAHSRILLEVCAEGCGHRERQLALMPHYERYGTVQVAASGTRPFAWAHEHWPGHRLVYDSHGRIRPATTLGSLYL